MKDFLGQELKVGAYFVYPGSGNTKAEYGLILYKIVGLNKTAGSIRAERIHAWDPNEVRRIERQQSTIRSFTKLCVVTPHPNMIKVFEGADLKYYDLIQAWQFGRRDIDWDHLTFGPIW